MPNKRGELRILAGQSGVPFADKVVDKLRAKNFTADTAPIKGKEVHFANTEIKYTIGESIRDADVYIIQDVANSVEGYSINDNHEALKTAIEAAWRSDAMNVTAVIPTFAYARQDKQDGREGITAARAAREIEDAGANHVITLDIHNTAISGYFRKAKLENLRASRNLMRYVRENPKEFNLENLVVTAPDLGGAKRAEHYAQNLGIDIVFAYKTRNHKIPNSVEKVHTMGDVEGKNVLIVDDMIDTAGTLCKVVEKLKENGAARIYAACSLPFFNKDPNEELSSLEKIDLLYEEGILTAVIGTDAVYHGGEVFMKAHPWFREVSVASYFAKVINKLNKRGSVSELLE